MSDPNARETMNDAKQMTAEDRQDLENLLQIYRRRLGHINIQRASLGIHCPAHLTMEAEDVELSIIKLEEQLGTTHPDVLFDALPHIETRLAALQKNVKWLKIKKYQLFGCTVWTVVETIAMILLVIGLTSLLTSIDSPRNATATPMIAHPTSIPTPVATETPIPQGTPVIPPP